MPDYMVLLYATEPDDAELRERWAELPEWDEVTESLREAGLLVANGPLDGANEARTVRVRPDAAGAVDRLAKNRSKGVPIASRPHGFRLGVHGARAALKR